MLENDNTRTEFNYANLSIRPTGLKGCEVLNSIRPTGMKGCEVLNSKFAVKISSLNSDHHNTLEELMLNTASLFQISVGFAGKDGLV